jgi:Peptidase A4 family
MKSKRLITGLLASVLMPITMGVGSQVAAASTQVEHGPMVASRPGANVPSANWAGYASSKKPFTSVSASWVQPAVKCTSQATYAVFWVGLDGYTSSTVEQTGTSAFCSGGKAKYAGWYEFFPAAPKNFSPTVAPGDLIHASVTESGGVFTTEITDTTHHWIGRARKTVSSAQRSSAEIIAEAPSSITGVLPLANFGTVKFTDSLANGTAIGSHSPIKITMESGGVVKAQPGALSSNENFSVAWHHS